MEHWYGWRNRVYYINGIVIQLLRRCLWFQFDDTTILRAIAKMALA